MIVYQETKAGFLRDAFTRDIEEVILAAFKQRTGHAVSRSEVRSWKESLIAVAKVVNDTAVPDDAGVGIEFGIPQTSKRIDFILSGMGDDQREQLVIVELKQWDSAKKTDRDGNPGPVFTEYGPVGPFLLTLTTRRTPMRRNGLQACKCQGWPDDLAIAKTVRGASKSTKRIRALDRRSAGDPHIRPPAKTTLSVQ